VNVVLDQFLVEELAEDGGNDEMFEGLSALVVMVVVEWFCCGVDEVGWQELEVEVGGEEEKEGYY
jgi:hypothetical protein